MKCVGCGNEVPTGMSFCQYCGLSVFTTDKTQSNGSIPTEKIRCSSCGAMVKRNNTFCTVCGTSLAEQFSGEQWDRQGRDGNEKRTKGSYGKRIAVILIVLSLLAAVLVIAWFVLPLLGHDHDGDGETQQVGFAEEQISSTSSSDTGDTVSQGQDTVHEIDSSEREETSGAVSVPEDEGTPARYFTKKVDGNLNVRALPKHESGLICTITDQTLLYFYGEVEQGLGSDQAVHDWYKITIDQSTQGWVRSDLVQEVFLSN